MDTSRFFTFNCGSYRLLILNHPLNSYYEKKEISTGGDKENLKITKGPTP